MPPKATKTPPAPSKEKAPKAKPKSPKTKDEAAEATPRISAKIRVLQALSDASTGLTRNELSEATGIKKGWSKILGTVTEGKPPSSGLEFEGLVKSAKIADQRGLVYSITAAGRKVLAKG